MPLNSKFKFYKVGTFDHIHFFFHSITLSICQMWYLLYYHTYANSESSMSKMHLYVLKCIYNSLIFVFIIYLQSGKSGSNTQMKFPINLIGPDSHRRLINLMMDII